MQWILWSIRQLCNFFAQLYIAKRPQTERDSCEGWGPTEMRLRIDFTPCSHIRSQNNPLFRGFSTLAICTAQTIRASSILKAAFMWHFNSGTRSWNLRFLLLPVFCWEQKMSFFFLEKHVFSSAGVTEKSSREPYSDYNSRIAPNV